IDPMVYSFDFGNQGIIFVAYADLADVEITDIFLASDSTGEFVTSNITDDADFQFAPVLKMNQLGEPSIVYVEGDNPDAFLELRYGWIGPVGFTSEMVADNMYQDDYLGYDLILKRGSIQLPQVFYIGNDGYLWYACSGELAWMPEAINDLSSEWPSAMADPLGTFHVAYDVGGSGIHYITNMMGSWQDEVVFEQLIPEAGNERPSLGMEIVYGSYLGIGNPHVVWMHAETEEPYDLWYAGKKQDSWNESVILETSEKSEFPGYGSYFALDYEGYGHLTFCREDEEYVTQIFYARSAEPLIVTGVSEEPADVEFIALEVRGSEVHLNLPVSGTVTLDLYDASGRRIENLASGRYTAGEHTIPINSAGLPAGVYFVRGQIGEYTASDKFVVTR
ncbi:T9SS type A sorting domain-containing protein, partial [candidate division WOR-3 bacterium]|nr:T9SS type A sorting domain-containing protein [candidate division WOR-3 bacterium]MBD3363983.1 T9SS type A sorting domain-containing protein [candidate division WOR-3 bacterium]